MLFALYNKDSHRHVNNNLTKNQKKYYYMRTYGVPGKTFFEQKKKNDASARCFLN